MSLRIVVADDHEIVRAGLKSLLQGTDIKIVAEAATGEAAVRLALKHDPDVLLLDVQMPDGDGLAALGKLKSERPNLPILIWSAFDYPNYVARAVALGANGYVLKTAGKEKLVQAIRTAATGETTWTREELRRITGALATPRLAADMEISLTQRESEVLRHLAKGSTNKEIAVALKISYETVKEHVQHVLRKLGVVDRTQAALWAVRRNLV